MASNSQPEKKQKFDEQLLEKKDDALLNPTRGDDVKDEKETPNDNEEEEEEEEEEYSDVEYGEDDDLDKPINEIGWDTSEEDCDTDEYKDYMRTIRESEGFNVPDKPPGIKISAYGPVRAHNFERMEELSKAALVWYKEKKEEEDTENYELVRVDCGSAMPDRGILYYITFIARAVGANRHVTFRAKVLSGIEVDIEVDSCEIARVGSLSTTQ